MCMLYPSRILNCFTHPDQCPSGWNVCVLKVRKFSKCWYTVTSLFIQIIAYPDEVYIVKIENCSKCWKKIQCALCVSINVHVLMMLFLQAKSSYFHNKHNICCVLDEKLPKMDPFKEILKFIGDSRINKALTDQHKYYESHMKDENKKDIDVEVLFTVADVRRVLDLKDSDEDPIIVPEILCKGLWMRMGYTGFVNDQTYTKSKLPKPYKFLVHFVIHAVGHRKCAFDESADYIMNIITCLFLNSPYYISQVIFNHIFVQMLLDDQIQNLPMDDGDELKLEHMDNETLKRLDVYRGVEKGKEPKFRKKFAAIEKAVYKAPKDDKWRHDNSGFGDETKKMEHFIPKKTRWWVLKDEKKKRKTPTPRTPKATTPKAAPRKQKSPPRLVDEPIDLPENVDVSVAGDLEIFFGEIEAMKEMLVEGEVHTDSGGSCSWW
ncbi:hypothetical protein Hanom_Chr09g00761871 [Helianthus anomalus]